MIINQQQADFFPYCGKVFKVIDSFLQTVMEQSCNLISSILPLASSRNIESFTQFLTSTLNQSIFSIPFKNIYLSAHNLFERKEHQNHTFEESNIILQYITQKNAIKLNIIQMIDDYGGSLFLNNGQKWQDLQTNLKMLKLIEQNLKQLMLPQPNISKDSKIYQQHELFIESFAPNEQPFPIFNQLFDPSLINQKSQQFTQLQQIVQQEYDKNALQKNLILIGRNNQNQDNDILVHSKGLKTIFQISNQQLPMNYSAKIQLKTRKSFTQLSSNRQDQDNQQNQRIWLEQQRNNLYNKMIKMKNKLSSLNLFERDKEDFKLCLLNIIEIRKKVYRSSLSQLKRLVQKVEQMRLKLQQMCRNIEQTCFSHRQNVYYICMNQYLKKRIYLCNQCMSQIKQNKQNDNHTNHQIACKRHRKRISYKSLLKKQSMDIELQKISHISKAQQYQYIKSQVFLCQQCIIEIQKNEKLTFKPISLCHFEFFNHLCIQQLCIKNDEFKICPICQYSMHQNHRTISFQTNTLMQQFRMKNEIDTSLFQQLFIDIRQRLKLHPIKKNLDTYVKEIWNKIKFMESFMVSNNRQVQQWVNCVIEHGRNKDMYVLWGVLQIKRRNIEYKQRVCFLQIFRDQIKNQLEILFTSFSQKLESLRQKINYFAAIKQQEMEISISNKYEKVINIEDKNKIMQTPCRLEQINPIYFDYIQVIEVSKQKEQDSRQKIDNQLKKQRIRFFKFAIWQMFKEAHVPKTLQKQIFYSLVSQQKLLSYIFPLQIYDNIDYQKDRQAIQIFNDKLRNWLERYKKLKQEENQGHILNFIKQKQLTNLKIIRIRYPIKSDILHEIYEFSISAYEFFEIMHNNKQLQQFSVKGVEIKQFKQFIRQLRRIKCNDIKYQNDQHMVDIYKWMRQFNPKNSIELTLNGKLSFDFNRFNMMEDIDSFCFFLGYFQSVSDISVTISCHDFIDQSITYWQYNLKNVIQQLRKIKKFTLNIDDKQFSIEVIKVLFNELSQFTNIQKINFQGFDFSKDTLFIQNYIRNILQKNAITHLGILWCKMFPGFPQISTLQSIQIWLSTFEQYPIISNCVKHIRINSQSFNIISQSSMIDGVKFEDFKQLQILHIQSSHIDRGVLQTLFCKNIKQLSLLGLQCQNSILSQFFLKLVCLNKLDLIHIPCRIQAILLIPSLELRELTLIGNHQITNNCLQAIDSKWPYLKKIIIKNCPKVDERIFGKCKFKSLINLDIEMGMIKEIVCTLQYLKKRGIQVSMEDDFINNENFIKTQQIANINGFIMADKIQVLSQKQEVDLEEIQQIIKDKIRLFYQKDAYEVINGYSLTQIQRQNILTQFIEKMDINNLKTENEFLNNPHLKIEEQLKQKYLEIQSNITQKINFFKIIDRIVDNKVTNLRCIRLTHSYFLQHTYKVTVSAFKVFKVIILNPNLEQVCIDGIKVTDFQAFITFFMSYRENYYLQFIDNPTQLGKYCFALNKSIYCLINRQFEDNNWIQNFFQFEGTQKIKVFSKLKLKLNAQIQIYQLDHSYKTNHRIKNIQEFLKQFKEIGGVEVILNLEKIQFLVPTIMETINIFKSIKLRVISKDIYAITQYDPFFQLLDSLQQSQINIVGLSLQQFNIKTKNSKILQKIEQNLSNLINKNELLYFKCNNCEKLPVNQVSSLFKNLSKRLSILSVQKVRGFDDVSLSSISMPFNLKYLTLSDHEKIINSSALNTLFSKLSHLVYLSLSDSEFEGKILHSIPSPSLKQLHLTNCSQFYNLDLENINKKWNYLRKLSIIQCKMINVAIFERLVIQKLIQLRLSEKLPSLLLNHIRRNGVRVVYNL